MGKTVQPIKNLNKEIDLIQYLKKNDKRIYILYLMLRYTGFRISDILPLKVRDVKGCNELEIQEKKTKNRKGKEKRRILMHKDLRWEIEEYIRGMDIWETLFPNNREGNEPLSYVQVYRILKEASEAVGIKDFGTHSGRKTCAYHIYMATESLDEVKNFLMHDDKRDTIRYVGIEQEVRDKTINKIDSPLEIMRRN